MKSFSCIAILSSILLAVTSCEQHRWENEVEVIKEPVYDDEHAEAKLKDKQRGVEADH